MLFIIVLILLILIASRINFRKWFYGLQIPGPFPLPFIGNGLMILNNTAAENMEIIEKLKREYGEVVAVWAKTNLYVMISDPKAVELLLSSSKFIQKADDYKFVQSWLNEGLLLSKGKKWLQRRKILTPAFHFKILEQFVEIFDHQSSVFVDNLTKYSQSDQIEIFHLVTLFGLDVICETAMGIQINAQQNSNSEYVLAVKKLSHVIHIRMFTIILREDFIYKFSNLCKEESHALKILHGFTDKVISERRNKILTQDTDGKENFDESIGLKRKMAFLDILLQATIDGKPLSNLDIREEVDTFMFEGHDTTTSGITFCFYCIAQNPDVQQKCFQEIRDVLGDDRTRPVSFNDLNNLNYLDLVIKETLRLFPSVPLIGRVLPEEIVIDKYTIPKGTNVAVPIYLMGHDPKLFSDPEEFRPERFSVENNAEKTHPFSYIPFSAGPRNCIGQKFAFLEMKSLVSKVLRYFEISLTEDSREYPILLAELILIPESEIKFYLKPRLY